MVPSLLLALGDTTCPDVSLGEGMFVQVICWACSHARGLCWEVLIGSDNCSSVCLGLRTLLLGVLGVGRCCLERRRSLLPCQGSSLCVQLWAGVHLKVPSSGCFVRGVVTTMSIPSPGLVLPWSLFSQVVMWAVGGMSPPSLSPYMLPSAALPFCASDPREEMSQPSLTP